MSDVFLVSCVKTKLDRPAAAKDLYTSSWFLKAREYIEKHGAPWYILSAEHGLLSPDAVIPPYEKTLRGASQAEKQAWAARVESQMEAVGLRADRIVVLAGEDYRAHLMPALLKRAQRVEVPMTKMRSGMQRQWLKSQLAGR